MKYIIFTDGASRGNPGNGGYGAIIAEYSNEELGIKNKESRVREIGGREDDTTNNRMEMMAAIEALKTVPANSDVQMFTDSAYLINGITKWVWAWQKNNWQTKTKQDVLNADLWQELVDVSSDNPTSPPTSPRLRWASRLRGTRKISWHKLSGHAGIPANERCDRIATSYADGMGVALFHGRVEDYKIDLSVTEVESHKVHKVESEQASRKKSKAYSYVSMVNGKIEIHQSWAECEARVKGVSGARYKKAISEEDEQKIIEEFSQKL